MPDRLAMARRLYSTLWLCGAVLLLGGCENKEMAQARQSISDVEAALVAAGSEPAKYTPDLLKDVNTQLDVLKTRYESADYAGVLAAAPVTLAAARALPGQAQARKAELHAMLQREWAMLATEVPAQIEATRTEVERLSINKQRPEGATVAVMESARKGIDDARALWERALAEQAAAHPEQAVTLANQAKDRTASVAALLAPPSAPVAVPASGPSSGAPLK